MSFRNHIRILKPREETYTPPVEKVQSFFIEELSPSEELQEAIKLVERIDSKINEKNF